MAVAALAAAASLCGYAGHTMRSGNTVVVDHRDGAGRAAVVYRVDDEYGYWTYPAATAEFVVLLMPYTAPALNVYAAQRADSAGHLANCAPAVSLPARGEPPDLHAGSVVRLSPAARAAAPLPCREVAVEARPSQALEIKGPPGAVDVQVDVDAQGVVTAASIRSSPSPALAEPALAAVRRTRFIPAFFRCQPIAGRYVVLVQVKP